VAAGKSIVGGHINKIGCRTNQFNLEGIVIDSLNTNGVGICGFSLVVVIGTLTTMPIM
jgi:hypothetical protein